MRAAMSSMLNGSKVAAGVALIMLVTVPMQTAEGGHGHRVANSFPVAAFAFTASGLRVEFDASPSYDPDGDPLTYAWAFGDGSSTATSTASPFHAYSTNGNFTVTLSVSDGRGGLDSTARVVPVRDNPPSAEFSFAALREHVDFDASASTDPDGDPIAYDWDFGDGVSLHATAALVGHDFEAGGQYVVTLRVSDSHGAHASNAQSVTAVPAAYGLLEDVQIAAQGWAYRSYPGRTTALNTVPGYVTAATSPCSVCPNPTVGVTLYLGDGFLPTATHFTCQSNIAANIESCTSPVLEDRRWFIGLHNDGLEAGIVQLTADSGPEYSGGVPYI